MTRASNANGHRLLRYMLTALALGAFNVAQAAVIAFVPPNDPVGAVFSTNNNDGWSAGRGDVFNMSQTVTIDSIGLFHNLTNILLSYELAQVNATNGLVTSGQTILRSGSQLVNTNGLQWIDFDIADLILAAGQNYHIEFTFSGNGNQNFFYNNQNIPFAQNGFQLIDGTQAGNSSNFVMPAIRVSTAVPEPSSLALLGAALAGLGFARRRKLH